jgi:vancomycin permeability regulator SanA
LSSRLEKSFKGICYLGVSLLIGYVSAMILIAIDGSIDRLAPADVGIVFGSKVEADGRPSQRLQARLDKAVELYQEGRIPNILVSGALEPNGFEESEVMAAYLIENGVHPEHILRDPNGVDTYSSVENAIQIMQAMKFDSVVLISQFFHLPRARLAFNRFGKTEVYTAHANYLELRDIYALFREVAAYLVYLVKRY